MNTETLLDKLDDDQKLSVQLDDIKEMTVKPGLLRLPVARVGEDDDPEYIIIELRHPTRKNPEWRIEKPKEWTDDEALPKLMRWYDYRGPDYHQLQTDRLYVRTDACEGPSIGGAKGVDWEIVPPPGGTLKPRLPRPSVDFSPWDFLRPALALPAYFFVQFVTLWLFLTFGTPMISKIAAANAAVFTLFSMFIYASIAIHDEEDE